MDIKEEKQKLNPEEYTKIDYTKVKKIIKEYMILRNIKDEKEQKKLFSPLYRLYLKAIGKFTPK